MRIESVVIALAIGGVMFGGKAYCAELAAFTSVDAVDGYAEPPGPGAAIYTLPVASGPVPYFAPGIQSSTSELSQRMGDRPDGSFAVTYDVLPSPVQAFPNLRADVAQRIFGAVAGADKYVIKQAPLRLHDTTLLIDGQVVAESKLDRTFQGRLEDVIVVPPEQAKINHAALTEGRFSIEVQYDVQLSDMSSFDLDISQQVLAQAQVTAFKRVVTSVLQNGGSFLFWSWRKQAIQQAVTDSVNESVRTSVHTSTSFVLRDPDSLMEKIAEEDLGFSPLDPEALIATHASDTGGTKVDELSRQYAAALTSGNRSRQIDVLGAVKDLANSGDILSFLAKGVAFDSSSGSAQFDGHAVHAFDEEAYQSSDVHGAINRSVQQRISLRIGPFAEEVAAYTQAVLGANANATLTALLSLCPHNLPLPIQGTLSINDPIEKREAVANCAISLIEAGHYEAIETLNPTPAYAIPTGRFLTSEVSAKLGGATHLTPLGVALVMSSEPTVTDILTKFPSYQADVNGLPPVAYPVAMGDCHMLATLQRLAKVPIDPTLDLSFADGHVALGQALHDLHCDGVASVQLFDCSTLIRTVESTNTSLGTTLISSADNFENGSEDEIIWRKNVPNVFGLSCEVSAAADADRKDREAWKYRCKAGSSYLNSISKIYKRCLEDRYNERVSFDNPMPDEDTEDCVNAQIKMSINTESKPVVNVSLCHTRKSDPATLLEVSAGTD